MKLYLTSIDYYDFEVIRTIIEYEHMVLDDMKILKIRTDIPLVGQKYNLADKDINVFYLINRYNNDYLEKLNNFPVDVAVFIIKYYDKSIPNSLDDLQNIAWASLYRNLNDAKEHKI